jgi:hypothetical protein
VKDTYHVEIGTTATSQCPVFRNFMPIGYIAPSEAKALAEAFRQRDELLAALEQAVKRQGFTNEGLINARAIIANVKGTNK